MTSFITQCPHCRTSFRLSRSQLGAARGVVRCGACLEVFNASQRLQQEEGPGLAAPAPPPRPTTPLAPLQAGTPPAEDDTLWIHDDLDLDNLDLDEELAKLERQEQELARQLKALEHPLADADADADADEAWAEQLLRAESRADEGDLPSSSRTASEPHHTAVAETLSFTPVTSQRPAPPSPLAVTSVFSDALEQPERIEPRIGDVAAPQRNDIEHASASDTDPLPPRDEYDEPLFELENEPLQLDWQAQRKPWGRWLGWGLLNLIALLALGGQYVVYNYDELVRQDRYRPWFEQLCPSLGCTLPPKVDIEQIKSSNLVVRSHPDFNSALVVDAIIYNRASFAQPFPLLEVRFADINGQPLASRVFKPGEYLSGELAGRTEMPPQVPIHIALDILDPGAQAVNYSLSFRSPE